LNLKSSFVWNIMWRSITFGYRHFRTTDTPHLQESSRSIRWTAGLLDSVGRERYFLLFYAYHSVHRESILKKFKRDDTLVQYFIISCKSLYMFQICLFHDDGWTHTVCHPRCCEYSLIELLMMVVGYARNM
jgi:hypothetical protein